MLFFRGSQVLLSRRYQTGYKDGFYSVPAGHLDGKETILQAAVRETREEVGLAIQPEAVAFAGVLHRLEGDERIDFFVQVKQWAGEPVNAEPHKCDELRWTEVDDLPENTIPYVRRAIENFRSGVVFEEFGWD
jgi:8-oxo-dGTP pyrophosphatase MutT (NUDIX family)